MAKTAAAIKGAITLAVPKPGQRADIRDRREGRIAVGVCLKAWRKVRGSEDMAAATGAWAYMSAKH